MNGIFFGNGCGCCLPLPSGGCVGHCPSTPIVEVGEEKEATTFRTCMGMGVCTSLLSTVVFTLMALVMQSYYLLGRQDLQGYGL